MVEISIVSGTYNRLPLLQKLVASCQQSVGSHSYEIVLVDGGSTDGTIEWCKERDDVRLIEQGELLGAIRAFNAGCRAAQGDYVAILNDDIEVVGDTLARSRDYLYDNPHIGQIAFENIIKGKGDPKRTKLSKAYGLLYGQCCMTPRWLGDIAGWWGDDGMRTYGGDTRLSLRLWELGYPTVPLEGCAIIDHVFEDELRKINSDDPWAEARAEGRPHYDLEKFTLEWKGRVPAIDRIILAHNAADTVLEKAHQGNLRTLRYKGMMSPNDPMRMALIDEFGKLGQSHQINQYKALGEARSPDTFQKNAIRTIAEFAPDLLILQCQRPRFFTPETVWKLRQSFPLMYIVNFDGDVHSPLDDFHFEIARVVHLQCIPSPTLFPEYAQHGVGVAYWPIGIENEYVVDRADRVDGPDVVFLGTLYGHGDFPEAQTREDAVYALWEAAGRGEIVFTLKGKQWDKIGIEVEQTGEMHADNAHLYSRSKMVLSVSQSADLWGYTSDRLYNICATGCPALVQRFAGMEAHGFIDGETCIAWADLGEMMDKVRYYLDHDEERERIGLAGQSVVLSRHTWKHRVDALFTMIEGFRKESDGLG